MSESGSVSHPEGVMLGLEPSGEQDAFTSKTHVLELDDIEIRRIVEMAANVLGAPFACLNVPVEDQFRVAASVGVEVDSFPRSGAMCQKVITTESRLIVPDFSVAPEYAGEAELYNLGFYAGIPLTDENQGVIASLCVFGPDAKDWSEKETELLQSFALGISRRLMLVRVTNQLHAERSRMEAHDRFFYDSLDLNCVASVEGRFVDLNKRWSEVLGYSMDELLSTPFASFIHPDDVASTQEVIGDLIESRRVVRFRNRYKHRDGYYLWLEWNAFPPSEDQPHIFASARDVSHLVEAELELDTRGRVLEVIRRSHGEFISSGGDSSWWNGLLSELLSLTESEYGFIGVTGEDDEGPFLRTLAITNIAWNDETRKFYEENAPTGMVFRNMDTLFGRAIVEEQAVLANDVATDSRAGGRPNGHPPLNTFAGLPIVSDQSMVGLVGLANRSFGYDQSVVDTIDPILGLIGTVIQNQILSVERREVEKQLVRSRQVQSQLLASSDTAYIGLRSDGEVTFVNPRFTEMSSGLPSELRTEAVTLEERLRIWFGDGSLVNQILTMVAEGAMGDLEIDEATLCPNSASPIPVRVRASLFKGEGGDSGVLISLTDRSADHRLIDSERLNLMLEIRIEDLKRTQRENEILSECVEFLQNCVSLEEGLQLIERAATRLFGTDNLTIYGSTEHGSHLHLRYSKDEALDELSVKDCWALRSRRVYGSGDGMHHLPCRHTTQSGQPTFCIPLWSLDRNVALISVPIDSKGSTSIAEQDREARHSQYVAMAQSISGALSTIALRESLEQAALTDELTSLPNRRSFQTDVARMLSRHSRTDEGFAFALLDIDHFKRVNDTYGHDVGDRVLQTVARVMSGGIRGFDVVARVGGEEFGLLLCNLTKEAAEARFEAIRDEIAARCQIGGEPVTVSVGGLHSSSLREPPTYERLYRVADEALYMAKELGRNKVVMSGRVPTPSAAGLLKSDAETVL